MILKYRDINKNWGYIETERFTIGKLIIKEPPACDINLQPQGYVSRDMRFKKAQIREKIGLKEEHITLLLDKDEGLTSGYEYITAIADNTEQREAFVLPSYREAYLMTDTGKTIERIA
jgi:hypothetical protein